jgi:lysophospholipase L1-like esterase
MVRQDEENGVTKKIFRFSSLCVLIFCVKKITMKQILYFLFFISFTFPSKAQQIYDSSFRFYYYDQKLSMFEQMPTPKNCIIWLGDSITDGGEWSELFPHYNTMNRGISADNTFGILYRLHEIIRRKPKKLFILIGINDIGKNIPDEVIVSNYRKIIDSLQLQTPSTKIYVQSILPTNNNFTNFKNHQNKTEHIAFVNKELKKLCAEKEITYVNLHDAFLNPGGKLDEKYTNDGLHLTGEGYLKWKEVLVSNGFLK